MVFKETATGAIGNDVIRAGGHDDVRCMQSPVEGNGGRKHFIFFFSCHTNNRNRQGRLQAKDTQHSNSSKHQQRFNR